MWNPPFLAVAAANLKRSNSLRAIQCKFSALMHGDFILRIQPYQRLRINMTGVHPTKTNKCTTSNG